MNNLSVKEGKTIAIISYITIIGTLIAFIMNQNKHNYFASFHIRQALGIFLLGVVVNFIQRFTHFDWFDTALGIGVFVLWILGLISAIQGQEKPIPLLGEQFQEWFRNIA
ncbi:hypothetical protein [Lutimonas sp.]|uniref:hypothetical protein n=1 Tax=Lutimonas sp. TaxID=1872403 RepID=UPI003D9AD0EB